MTHGVEVSGVHSPRQVKTTGGKFMYLRRVCFAAADLQLYERKTGEGLESVNSQSIDGRYIRYSTRIYSSSSSLP